MNPRIDLPNLIEEYDSYEEFKIDKDFAIGNGTYVNHWKNGKFFYLEIKQKPILNKEQKNG